MQIELGGPDAVALELSICADDPKYWFNWYAWTFDPRNATELDPPLPTWLPFDLFPRQEEMIDWIRWLMSEKGDGCIKKSRDVGFSCIAGGFAWHQWRFVPGFKASFCSNLARLVDDLGNPDTIFEKIRFIYRNLPRWMWPRGFNPSEHDKSLLLINPETGATITGEGGEEAGRGGRSTIYFIDEAAKIRHAEQVDAATSGNTECRVWGSSINPRNENNLFQKKYSSLSAERVFRFHYSDDPRKTKEWKARKQRDVLPENWASEYEIDDSYSVEDITIPATWVEAAKKIRALCKKHGRDMLPHAIGVAGGDVGGGKAQSVVVARFGPVVAAPRAWTDPDTSDTALKMLDYCSEARLPVRADGWEPRVAALRYDSVAIGRGVQATMRRNQRPGLVVVGINVGEPASDTKWPDGRTAQEMFANAKAEGWWTLRERFKKTYQMTLFLEGAVDAEGQPLGHEYPVDELISLPDEPNNPDVQRLCSQLSHPKWNRTEAGKIMIETKQAMARRKLASPDYADALVLTEVAPSKAEKFAAVARASR